MNVIILALSETPAPALGAGDDIEKSIQEQLQKSEVARLRKAFSDQRNNTLSLFQFFLTSEYSQLVKLMELAECHLVSPVTAKFVLVKQLDNEDNIHIYSAIMNNSVLYCVALTRDSKYAKALVLQVRRDRKWGDIIFFQTGISSRKLRHLQTIVGESSGEVKCYPATERRSFDTRRPRSTTATSEAAG